MAQTFVVGTKKASVDGTDIEQVDEIRRQVAALTDASIHRHGLRRGTPEYEAALEREESLADRVWKLGAALPPLLERRPDRQRQQASETPTKRTR